MRSRSLLPQTEDVDVQENVPLMVTPEKNITRLFKSVIVGKKTSSKSRETGVPSALNSRLAVVWSSVSRKLLVLQAVARSYDVCQAAQISLLIG